jgi:hypothetical protein
MLTFTKATLKTALQKWNTTADTEFVGELDAIIKRGELRLERLLDLEMLDSVATTTTAATVPEVFVPDNLIVDRLLMIDSGAPGKKAMLHRSRGWIELMNEDDEEGLPRFYCDFDEGRWFVTPIPNAAYLIYVHGLYRPASIADGNDDNTTWLSEHLPDLLFLACSVEACEFLKFWAHKASNEIDLNTKAAAFLGIAANLQRSDIEDLLGGRQNQNKPNTQGVTE